MPINFTQLFQDSWNFIRNQHQFTRLFTVAFFLISLLIYLLGTTLLEPVATIPNAEQLSPEQLATIMLQKINITQIILVNILTQVLFLLVSNWGILTIHHISLQHHYRPSQVLPLMLRRFAGVLVLNILLILPMVIGLINIWVALATQSPPSMFSVFAMLFGIFIFIRLCLAPVSYLITDKTLSESVSFTWKKGVKRTMPLFLYCVLVYFIFQLIGQQLASISDNLIFTLLVNSIIAFINTFALVFTYRFYTLFTQKV